MCPGDRYLRDGVAGRREILHEPRSWQVFSPSLAISLGDSKCRVKKGTCVDHFGSLSQGQERDLCGPFWVSQSPILPFDGEYLENGQLIA